MTDARPLVVAALGGNALSPPDRPIDPAALTEAVEAAAEALAPLCETHDLIVTHGNGPQVGFLAARMPQMPLDMLGAESEGWLGYVVEQALTNRLSGRTTLGIVTRVVIAADDPAFDVPTKPVGPVIDRAKADALAQEHGWSFVEDRGGLRRVVASPDPLEIVEGEEIGFLSRSGAVVVCLGGGGIPVRRDEKGALHGVEAVIDKDLASALLATSLGADVLLLLTDVPGVYADWPARDHLLGPTDVETLRSLDLQAGSMAPKVQAVLRFVEAGGSLAAIGALSDAAAMAVGAAGTVLRG